MNRMQDMKRVYGLEPTVGYTLTASQFIPCDHKIAILERLIEINVCFIGNLMGPGLTRELIKS